MSRRRIFDLIVGWSFAVALVVFSLIAIKGAGS